VPISDGLVLLLLLLLLLSLSEAKRTVAARDSRGALAQTVRDRHAIEDCGAKAWTEEKKNIRRRDNDRDLIFA